MYKILNHLSYNPLEITIWDKNDVIYRDLVLFAVKNGVSLKYFQEQAEDYEIVRTSVEKSGSNLEYCSEMYKDDEEIVTIAVKHGIFNLKYASERLKKDKEFILRILRGGGETISTFAIMNPSFAKDEDFIYRVTYNNPITYVCHIYPVKLDLKLILAIIKVYPIIRHYLSEEQLQSKEIVLELARKNVILDAFYKLELTLDDIWYVLEYNRFILKHIDKKYLESREFAMKAIKVNKHCIAQLENFQSDKEFVLECVKLYGCNIQHANDEFRSDYDVGLAAVTNDGNAIRFLDYKLRMTHSIVLAAVKQDGRAMAYIDKSFLTDNEIVTTILRTDPGAIYVVDRKFRCDRSLVLSVIKTDPDVIHTFIDADGILYRWALYFAGKYVNEGKHKKKYRFLLFKKFETNYFNIWLYGNRIQFKPMCKQSDVTINYL